MVYFTSDSVPAAHAALSVSEAGDWNDIRDGCPIPGLKRPTVGFRVTKYFKSRRLKSEFLPGMQGEVLKREGSGLYVRCKDLFDAKEDPLKEWVHEDDIEIGTKLYGDWSMDVCNIPRAPSKFTEAENALFKDPKCQHLALGISTFLRKLAETNPDCLMEADLKRLGGTSGNNVPWITTRVLIGVQKAGLLGVLNNPQFTMEELEANANLNCEQFIGQDEAGIYFRRYIGLKPTPNRSKKPLSLYVGQTVDFYKRCQSWASSSKQHEDVKAQSGPVKMLALCRLEKDFYKEHKFIVEQLFTSLLQTYKQALLDRNPDFGDDRGKFHMNNCCDMDKIASAAAKESKWTGAVQRISFWAGSYSACAGLNHQSPISEARLHEPSTWLESRGFMQDKKDPSKSFPISNFTCVVPKKMTVLDPTPKMSSKNNWFIVFDVKNWETNEYCLRITQALPDDFSSNSEDFPINNSYYNITIEVRTDWKPHPYSWARLPLIGPFMDWDRANSWAININWVSPSGEYRVKYFHCLRPYMKMNSESDAAIQPYARGIEMIRWLYRENIPAEQQHRWIQTPPFAKTKLVDYDYVRQMIKIKATEPVTTTAPISSNRKKREIIKAEMEGRGPHGDFGIQNVGLTLAEAKARGGKVGV